MKFSTNSLAGKLILFLGIISVSIILFIFILTWQTNQIKNRSFVLEKIHYPLAENLEDLEIKLDQIVFSIRESAIKKDTSGSRQRSLTWSASVDSTLRFVSNNKSVFSSSTRSLVDSIEAITLRLRESDETITNWITNNHLKADADSAFQASLESREQSELQPRVERLRAVQLSYKDYISSLVSVLDQQLKSDSALITQFSSRTKWMGVGLGILVLGILIGGGSLLLKRFRQSLAGSTNILDHLVKGEVTDLIKPGKDEFGVIIEAVNNLSNNLKEYSSFAQSIGEGNVDAEFQPISESDMLGNSLVQMRQKLKNINEEDRRRNWVTEGLAKFADLMRKSDDYEELGHQIISELVKYTKSNQGGLFILNRDDEHNHYLQLTACYAFERRKFLEKRIDTGQGLVGQCYQEGRTIYLKEIPPNYVHITSGLGGANPSALLIVPLKVNEEIEGVMELASFKEYLPHEIEFVEKVGEITASTISAARINTRTRKLLGEAQQHSEELRAQEEEMRQNMEEMQATQEQLHRQAEETRKMQEKLELEKSMFHILMEYLPDRITYKDRDSKILRVNKAKAVRFKVPAEEMIGKSDYDYFAKEHAAKAFKEEQEMIRTGEPKLNIEERAVTADGEIVWNSTSRIPFRNHKEETIGMFIITKDITQLKTAQATILDREKVIQRLLDNMPVFRYSIGKDGVIREVWKSKGLEQLPPIENKPAKELLPEVYDMIQQEGLNSTDIICKGVLEIDGEKEIFKHYLFLDSAFDGVYSGFALKQ